MLALPRFGLGTLGGPLDRMSTGRAVRHLNCNLVFEASLTIGAEWRLPLRVIHFRLVPAEPRGQRQPLPFAVCPA